MAAIISMHSAFNRLHENFPRVALLRRAGFA